MSMPDTVDLEAFREQWLVDVKKENPSSIELGRRFARKLVHQWLDIDDSSADLVYCDGRRDGGIERDPSSARLGRAGARIENSRGAAWTTRSHR